MWVVASLPVLLAIFLAATPDGYAREQPFGAGQWIGTESFDDDTGDLGHCRIEATFNSGITLAFGLLPDFTLLIVLTNPRWSLPDEVQFPLQLAVDRRWSKSVSGRGIAPNGVVAYIGDDWQTFEALRVGRELRVVAARETFEFVLKGTSFGLMEAARCVLRNSQVASKPDPFSVQSDPFGSDPSNGAAPAGSLTQSEVAGFLAAAGIENATLMTDAQRQKTVPYAQHAWTLRATIGAFAEYPLEGRSLQQVLAAEIAGLSERCGGRILSGSQPPTRIGDITLARFALTCDFTDGSSVVNGTLVLGDASVAAIEHFGMAAFTDVIKRADDLVAAAVEQAYHQD